MSVLVVFSVDVEEDGLFSGRYRATGNRVSNVAALSRLEFLTRELGLPLTLLCTWPVLANAGCSDILRRWQDELGAELGCHLHPWNTPPLAGADSGAWTPSESLPREDLDAKLGALVRSCAEVSGRAPLSFRMGRFDLGPRMRGLLPKHGLRVDSSLVPLRFVAGLPDSFHSPADPFLLPAAKEDDRAGTPLAEAPLTVVPVLRGLDGMASGLARMLPQSLGNGLLTGFRKVAAVGTQPVWYPLASMKLGAHLHLSRGGRVIHLFLHSSELAPGVCPHLPDEESVHRLTGRIRAFLRWLEDYARPLGGLRGVTMAGLLPHFAFGKTPEFRP